MLGHYTSSRRYDVRVDIRRLSEKAVYSGRQRVPSIQSDIHERTAGASQLVVSGDDQRPKHSRLVRRNADVRDACTIERCFFFKDTAAAHICTLSLHGALP